MSIPHYISDLIENLNTGVFFFDEKMDIFFANRAFIESIGVDRGEIERIRPHILDIFPEIDTDMLKSNENIFTDRGILRLLMGYKDEPFYGIGILNPQGLFQILKLELSKIKRGLLEMALVLIKLKKKKDSENCKNKEYEYINFLKTNLSSILRESDIIEESNLIRYGEKSLMVFLFMKERSFKNLRIVVDRIQSLADRESECIEGITIVGTFAKENDTVPILLERINSLLKEAGPEGSLIDVEE